MAAEALEESRKQVIRKPGRRTFHTVIGRPGDYQADILFIKYGPEQRHNNDGNTCMLALIEVPTRYAYLCPLHTKGADDVVEGFKHIFREVVNDEGFEVIRVTTDDGKEFNNTKWDKLMQDLQIEQYVKEAGDRYTLSIIDRFTRTIKTWIEDWQIEHESLRWVDALPVVMERYLDHKIRTLNASPMELKHYGDEFMLAQAAAADRGVPAMQRHAQFNIGDKVRLRLKSFEQPRARSKAIHASIWTSKGSERWSNEVYTIASKDRLSFALVDSAGNPAKRTYRQHELLVVPQESVDVPDIFRESAKRQRMKKLQRKEGLD